MKILIIMHGFFPGKKYGGPPVSVSNFCTLMKGLQVYIVTSNHDLHEKKTYENITPGWNKWADCNVLYIPDKDFNHRALLKIFCEIQPDWLYLQSFFSRCTIPALLIAKKKKTKVLLAPRGELCAGAFKKKYKKIPYIVILKAMGLLTSVDFQATSLEESKAIWHWLHIPERRIHLLTNVPTVPNTSLTAEKHKKCGSAKIVYISRIVPKKNLFVALTYFMHVKGNVFFDIYGPVEDAEYWKKCMEVIDMLPKNIQVTYCGNVGHDDVIRVFSEYDAFLFPTQSENFGHVIAESLAAGTPVITSDQTPWQDIEENNAGWFIALHDSDRFIGAIESVLSWNEDTAVMFSANAKRYAQTKMNINLLREKYLAAFSCRV